MADYNPHTPRILGQEWAPIRDESTTFLPLLNAVEYGHTFRLTSSQNVSTGRVYVHEPSASLSNQITWVTTYNDTNVDSGPIRQVIIPCSGGGVTGTGVSSASVALDLYTPSDGNDISFQTPDGNDKYLGMFFDVPSYYQLLQGKRILAVDFLYSGYGYTSVNNANVPIDPSEISYINLGLQNVGNGTGYNNWSITGLALSDGFDGANTKQIAVTQMGETTNNIGSVSGAVGYAPMAYNDLLRYAITSAAAAQRLMLVITVNLASTGNANNTIVFDYGALRVTFCEETRTSVGVINGSTHGVNVATMLDPYLHTTAPTLTAGTHLVTVSGPSLGEQQGSGSSGLTAAKSYPLLNATRELYSIPTFTGTQVNIPFPPADNVGEAFETIETSILPQISLHTSGGAPLTEVHAYGRQLAAQVWGTVTATQDVHDASVGGTSLYPWVRFYARRFGDTTIPLTITLTSSPSSTASITVADFDALEFVSGDWKEVTLEFSTPPTLGALNPAIFQWSASGETKGNRWEVLGAAAPALSGIPGQLFTPVPTTQQLGTATYQPPSGSTIELTWMPQGINGPAVSGATADTGSDAVILLGQDPPGVSGLTVTTLCQPLSGIGQDCEVDPCCVPSSVYFNQISWTALTSMPSSGFGYYQLQRSDTVDNEWQTIMEATSVTGSNFNDFEARVGIDSSYRIRAVDLYGFYGDWSDEVSATILEPGVTIGCRGDGHLLIFTSNENQCGDYTLAYSTVWEGGDRVVEDFTFPEANFTQLQAMYDRDYFTAFRPTERGGEQFQRTLLVQAAAISPPTLGDFRSLRDMAWDDVNYVCVRDEEGNRWFANVIVPAGRVLRNRRIYMAPVQIREVTATPTPVDPDNCSSTGQVCDDPFTCDEVVALDMFTRSVTGGWGEADVGGDWEAD